MKKVTRHFTTFLGVIAVSAVIVCFFASCGGDDPGGGTSSGITVPKVGDLPAFPQDSTPATQENVDSILAALKQSGVVDSVYNRMGMIIRDYREENDGSWENYSFKNREDDGNTVKVSANRKESFKMSKNFEEIYDSESEMKGKVTNDISKDGCTIVSGGTLEEQNRDHSSVTEGGTMESADMKYSYTDISKHTLGFTVTTSGSSVKIILDVSYIEEGNNHSESTSKCSGSLKVYGQGNTLLKTETVNNYTTYQKVLKLIGITANYGEWGKEDRGHDDDDDDDDD